MSLVALVMVQCLLVRAEPTSMRQFVFVNESGDAASPMGQSMIRLAELIKQASDGAMTARVFHTGELGGQQESYDQLMKGNVHVMLSWPGTSYDQRLGAIYMPYLVLGWQDAISAYSDGGWLKALLDPIFTDNGLKYFGPYPEGFGGVATKGRYATNRKDAAGIKVRSAPIFPLPQTVQAMGFDAVPIDWNEVYTSIQTGVVDGDSSNVIYWDYEYFGDLLDYFVHTRHNFSSFALMMNLETYNSLNEDQQAIFSTAADALISAQFSKAKTEDERWIEKAQQDGMTYIVPSNEELSAWVKQVRREVWPQAETAIGREAMENIQRNASTPN